MADDTAPSDTVLDETPARALKFLGAVSNNPFIRAVLAQRGYKESDHERGWSLLLRASGYRRPEGVAVKNDDGEVSAAISAIDAWDEPNFRVARAALAEFPDALDFVFASLAPATGAGAIVAVSTFLDRLDALENGKERKASRKDDHAALAKLGERGITDKERARLRDLLKVAKRGAPAASTTAPPVATTPADLRAAKLALRAFYAEWSEVAKADVKRRDYLIQLGLAKKKTGKRKVATPPVTPAPSNGASPG